MTFFEWRPSDLLCSRPEQRGQCDRGHQAVRQV